MFFVYLLLLLAVCGAPEPLIITVLLILVFMDLDSPTIWITALIYALFYLLSKNNKKQLSDLNSILTQRQHLIKKIAKKNNINLEYKIIAGHKLSPNFDIYADTKNKKLLIAGLNNNIRIFSYNYLKECSIIENDIIKYSYNFINKKTSLIHNH